MAKSAVRKILLGGACIVALHLAACGTDPADRAGAGAAVGAIAGDAGTGAVIGGLAGAAAGAVTNPCQLNLGDPFWRNKGASREDYYRRCGHYPR